MEASGLLLCDGVHGCERQDGAGISNERFEFGLQ